MAARRRRELPDVEGVSVEHGVGPAREEPRPARPARAAREAPPELPEPYESTDDGPMTQTELELFGQCEEALHHFRRAFATAGQALQVIRDGRLYRSLYPNFDAYCRERWEMSRTQADRLIRSWPYVRLLAPIGVTPNESQIRKILPLADRHGQDAAVTVYRTVAEHDGVNVTAEVLQGAIAVLPENNEFDPDAVAARIRAYLAGDLEPPTAPAPTPDEALAAEVHRVRTNLRRRAAGAGAATRRRYAAELRELADELEEGEAG